MKNLFFIVAFLWLTTLSVAQSETDIQTVIQMSIDIEELQPYFHPEKEGRNPLVIEANGVISSDLELVKFGVPVQFMQMKDLFFNNLDAFLEFDTFEISSTTATVLFRYYVEGIKIGLTFEKIDGEWMILTKKLSEI